MRTGPQNANLRIMIEGLKKKSYSDNSLIWLRVAEDLEKPTRQKRVVNLSRINRYTKDNETIIVPGKVLGSGQLDHKIIVAAFSFSKGALEKINQRGEAILIKDFMKEDIKGKRV